MQNTTLQLGQILQLETEVNGVVNAQTGENIAKGLMKEVLKFKTKYWLMQLSDDLVEEKKKIEAVRDQLVKELGQEDETGAISLPVYINEVRDEEGKIVWTKWGDRQQTAHERWISDDNMVGAEQMPPNNYKITGGKFEVVDSCEKLQVYALPLKYTTSPTL
jgi:hypothetical protein